MKQEEKELLLIALCGYLPHGVKCKNQYGDIVDLISISHHKHNEIEYREKSGRWDNSEIGYCKPILYPISSLTKEITVKGYNNDEPFVPVDEMLKRINKENADDGNGEFAFRIDNRNKYFDRGSHDCYDYINIWNHEVNCDYSPCWIIELLNKMHIDYRNLIDKGLAIDVNTLEKNPYL